MKKQTLINSLSASSLLTVGLLALTAPSAESAMTFIIQPNAAGDAWVFTASWTTGTTPDVVTNNEGFNFEDSLTGATLTLPQVRFADATPELASTDPIEWNGTASTRFDFNDIGNHIIAGSLYDNDAFGSGVGNVTALVGGPVGAYWDHDDIGGIDGTGLDDISIILPGTSFPSSGTIVVSGAIDTVNHSFTSLFNVGTWGLNPNVSLTVTTTAYGAVPEPSAFAMLGLGSLALLRRSRK